MKENKKSVTKKASMIYMMDWDWVLLRYGRWLGNMGYVWWELPLLLFAGAMIC